MLARSAAVLFTISTAFVVTGERDATAEEYVRLLAPRGSTTQGKSFSRDVNQSIGDGLLRKCVKDDEAGARAKVAEWTTRAGQLKDPGEREMFGKYLADIRTFVEAHLAGIPGRGTYAQLKAKYEQERAAFDAAFPKAPPTSAAEAKAAAAGLLDYRARGERYVKQYREMLKETLCLHHAGDWAGLAKQAESAKYRVQNFVTPILSPMLRQLGQWRPLAAVVDKPVPDEYWAHANHALEVAQLAWETEKMAKVADELSAWSPLVEGSDKAIAASAAADVAKVREQVGPLAAKLIAEVRPPKLPKRTENSARITKERKVLGPIVGPPGYSNQATTEVDKQDGRRYSFNRRHYSTYYVRQPDGAGPAELPDLPGIDRKQVCELWHQSFYTYTKGGPSVRPLNKWLLFQDWRVSYVLCKNAKTPTRMKMKK